MTAARAADDARGEVRLGAGALFVFFGLFLGWAALAPLDAAVVAPGVVVVASNRQTLQHREGGVVTRLAVREGQQVSRGEILIELGSPEVIAVERSLFSQTLDLQMQRQRLEAEIAGEAALRAPPEWAALAEADRPLAEATFARHAAQGRAGAWSEIQARIAGYRQEIVSVRRQETLMQEELDGMRALAAEQMAPLTRVRALERGLAELQGRRAELTAQIAAAQQDRQNQLLRANAQLAELAPRLTSAREQLERTRLRAPSDGVVVGLTAHTVGGVIAPGEHVLDVVPDDQSLVIDAQVRPEDADDIEPNQAVEVRITAFHGRDLPIVTGTVRQISADRFQDERTGLAYFKMQVVVPAAELARLAEGGGARRQLRPGLPAQVIAPIRQRTALQYLLEPLNQALWRSFREQ